MYVYFSFYIKIFLEVFSRQIHSCFFLFMSVSYVHVRLLVSVCFLFAFVNICSVDVLLLHFVIENVRICRYFFGCLS